MTPQLIATQCCGCQRIKTTGGTYASLYSLTMPPGVTYSHGYCPECEAKAWAELNAMLPEKKVVTGQRKGVAWRCDDR